MSQKICIVGHIDSGKSTFMGHYLYNLGVFTEADLRTATKSAEDKKCLAWKWTFLTDVTSEEQDRGITTDFFKKDCRIHDKLFTFIDTPGHAAYVNQMVAGSQGSETAVFIVSMKSNETENSLKDTEHLHILKCLGIKRVLVLLNKMDLSSEEYADKIKIRVSALLKQIRFKEVSFIPISALHGTNFHDITSYLLKLPAPILIEKVETITDIIQLTGLTLTSRLLSAGTQCVAHIKDSYFDSEIISIKKAIFTRKGQVYTMTIQVDKPTNVYPGLSVILRDTETLFISKII